MLSAIRRKARAVASLSWKPVRRGDIYCAPACGHGCKWAQFEEAKREAESMVADLGLGWAVHLNENAGWHASARVVSKGEFHVSSYRNSPWSGLRAIKAAGRYSAILAGHYCGDGPTPVKAAQAALAEAAKELEALRDIGRFALLAAGSRGLPSRTVGVLMGRSK